MLSRVLVPPDLGPTMLAVPTRWTQAHGRVPSVTASSPLPTSPSSHKRPGIWGGVKERVSGTGVPPLLWLARKPG